MAKNILKATGVVLIMNLVVKVLGFMRETSLANAFGASELSDAYLSAYTIPYFLQAILGFALVTAVVPILTKYLVAGQREEASYAGSAIINATALVLTVLTVLGIWSCDLLVSLLAPGYGAEQAALTADLARIMFPSVVFMGVGMVLTGICNAHYKFAVSAFAPGMSNIIIIVALLFFSASYGIFGAAWGTLFSFVGFFAVQVPVLWQIGFKYRPVLDFKHPAVRQLMREIGPIVLGVAVNQIYFAVNRIFASGLAEGTISNINYANKLMMLPVGIFVAAVANAIYPALTEFSLKKDRKSLAATMKTGLVAVMLVAVPAAVGLAVLAEPIIELLFEHGEFTHDDTLATAWALVCFTVGLIPMSANMLITRVFYALEDVKTPVRIGMLSVVLDVVLSVALFRVMAYGGGGLALANSLAALFCCLLMYYYLKLRALPELAYESMLPRLVKIAVAALGMGAAVWLAARVLTAGALMTTAVGVLIGVAVYAVLILALRVPETQIFLNKLLKKRR
ncbi:MAG: murein biosynthesis integral membrane protein MurJ [Firmicutes bacterium]|nr:murein biosynthesis integral membrane protein MurJ [Bacillota bacterium]